MVQGSFYYNGEKQTIHPGTTQFGDSLSVTLDYRKIGENAEFAVLKMCNCGDKNTEQITDVKTLDIRYAAEGAVAYHTLSGDSCGASSFMPLDLTIQGQYHEEPMGGRSSNTTGFPYFDLTWGEQTDVYAIGWTGQWSKDIWRTKEEFGVQIGLCDSDFYLLPGEEVRFPSVLIVHGTDPASARRSFRNLMREEFSPKKRLGDGFRVPVAIQCFDRYFQALSGAVADDSWATEKGQIRTIEAAKKLEYIDTLWLDAAWFAKGFPHGVGNFRFSEGFPNGLKPVSEYAHSNGMKFVVWFEPERVYEGSDLYGQEDKLLKLEEENPTRLYDLSDEAARTWLEETLIGMIRENGIDVYRQDFNMEPLEYWRRQDGVGRRGITEMKYVDGLYRLWDRLLAEFPELLIDNCSSGGRRLDLETAMRSITLWRSDTGCFGEDEERRVTIWNHNQILGLAEYLPYHACAVWEPDAYTVRSTATHGMACNFDIFNPDFDFAGAAGVLREVQEMKKYWDGDFYPLTQATEDESVWSAYQLALPDSGAVYVFRREKSPVEEMKFALHGLEENGKYVLTFIDEKLNRTEKEYAGQELLAGIPVAIPEKRSSMVITYERV